MIQPRFEELKELIEIENSVGLWAKVTPLVPSSSSEIWQAQQPIICRHYQVWLRETELLDHLPLVLFQGSRHRIVSAPSLLQGFTYFIMQEIKE